VVGHLMQQSPFVAVLRSASYMRAPRRRSPRPVPAGPRM